MNDRFEGAEQSSIKTDERQLRAESDAARVKVECPLPTFRFHKLPDSKRPHSGHSKTRPTMESE